MRVGLILRQSGRLESDSAFLTLPPAAPVDLAATAAPDTLELAWTDNADNEDRYNLEIKQDVGDGWTDWMPLDSELPANTETYTLLITDNGQYQFRVRAENNAGESDWNESDVVEGYLPVNGETELLPSTCAVQAVYPNPFNPATTVRFQVDRPGMVKLTVFDIMGRQVALQTHAMNGAGVHTTQFNLAGHATGVYLLRSELPDGSRSMTRMHLVK